MREPADHGRLERIAAFYADQHTRLRRTVHSKVRGASRELVEDACSHAWTVLLTRPDIDLDQRGFGWLLAVATHEAWHLARRRQQRGQREQLTAEPDVLLEIAGIATPSSEQQALAAIDAHRRLALLARLREHDRRALYLLGLGYSHAEIAQITRSSHTRVGRRIHEGRTRLRALAREDDQR